jgi:enoyl-CoA hydratase/3-hydroxyacyl-CoA dehydrogenase
MKVGVVGAGNMGSGIAQKYATEGFDVVVLDLNEESVKRGKERVEATLNEGVERGIFKAEKRDQILGRMTFSTDVKNLSDADLVVEAVFEDLDVKKSLFKSLDEACAEKTLLATNTSSFFVRDVGAATQRPDRVLGLHYFYHPAKNRLVEVIKGDKTSQEAFDKAWVAQEQSGKIPVESGDAPGFIVNRYFVPWLNESMRIVEEGEANLATVEAAAKEAFGVGMGPFELMNVTGVPITLHAATTLGNELGAFYAPCDLIRPKVEAKENWDLSGEVDTSKMSAVADRLWGVVFQIATRIVFDEKVCSLEDCDLGARVGLRWPRGPFEAMNDMGTDRALALVRRIADRYDDVEVPSALTEMGEKRQPFQLLSVLSSVVDGVGTLTLNRPDALNALNENVVAQLGEAFDGLAADASVKGIVIRGRGKAFVAGADTKFFVDRINADDVPRIVDFASGGQDIFRRIDTCEKPVVCVLDGLSLGGGSELALACDWVVATEKGTLGFPETGIGIYPGLGGTQRSARRAGIPLARWLVFTGDVVGGQKALSLGLIDDLVTPAELEEKVRTRALSGETRPERAPPESIPEGFDAVAGVFSQSLEDLRGGKMPEGADDDPRLAKMIKKVGFKAPLALRAADMLLEKASGWTLAEGLKAETEGLDAIFRSADALEGLSSIGKRRPSFEGK